MSLPAHFRTEADLPALAVVGPFDPSDDCDPKLFTLVPALAVENVTFGDVEDGHAWIRIDPLLMRLANSSDFDAEQFSAMVAYAVEHGSVSRRSATRAHPIR